jgi:hypothetical protein
MNIWIYEYMNIWIYEYMNMWIYEYMNIWIYEYMNMFLIIRASLWSLMDRGRRICTKIQIDTRSHMVGMQIKSVNFDSLGKTWVVHLGRTPACVKQTWVVYLGAIFAESVNLDSLGDHKKLEWSGCKSKSVNSAKSRQITSYFGAISVHVHWYPWRFQRAQRIHMLFLCSELLFSLKSPKNS